MRLRPVLPTLGLLAFLAGCDAGIPESGDTRISSFTPSFPDGDGCAVRGDGSVLCRGGNDYGRFGAGAAAEGTYDLANTVPVEAPIRFSAVSVGWAHACALDGGGAVWCWGLNHAGQLGVGDTLGPEGCDGIPSYYPTVFHR